MFKTEETMSMEARCVASLGFAYHDCEGAELTMLKMMLRPGLCLIGEMTRLKSAMTSHYFLSGHEHGVNRHGLPEGSWLLSPQNASACESLRKSALDSKYAGTQRQKYFTAKLCPASGSRACSCCVSAPPEAWQLLHKKRIASKRHPQHCPNHPLIA